MANTILIVGESGAGKTTSLRNLDPSTTLYIDADKKGLAWPGWRKQYSEENKNYLKADSQEDIYNYMVAAATNDSYGYKTIVIDTLNGIMVADEGRRRKEKGFDKWQDLAWSIWTILDYALVMPDDMTVIFTGHTQTDTDESGNRFTHLKTSGRKLEKIVPESKIRTVLHAKRVDGEYVFETRSDNSTAKDGMYSTLPQHIPNDVMEVMNALHAFDFGKGGDGND